MTSTQEQAQEAAAQAKDKAGEAAGQAAQQARGQARDQVDQRSTQAGERVSAQASDVRSVATALREQGQDQPAKLADQAADRAERLGQYLQDADTDRILNDLEDLGRRQPMALMLGGLTLGFLASRVIKASSQQRYASSGGGTRPMPVRGTTRALPTPRTTVTPGAGKGTIPGAGTAGIDPDDTNLSGRGSSIPDPVVGGASRTDPRAPRDPLAPQAPLPPARPAGGL